MTIIWDVITVEVVNRTALELTLSDVQPLPHGQYGQWPVASIARSATAAPAFEAHSVKDAEIGPGPGVVVYGLSDGCELTIDWEMVFAEYQQSYVNAQVSGAGASSYEVSVTCSQEYWHGQGKRFKAAVAIAVGSGASAGHCSKEE